FAFYLLQAEDGIRDFHVTGVQTCALPIFGDVPILGAFFRSSRIDREERELLMIVTPHLVQPLAADAELPALPGSDLPATQPTFRSEERRVGIEVRSRGSVHYDQQPHHYLL